MCSTLSCLSVFFHFVARRQHTCARSVYHKCAARATYTTTYVENNTRSRMVHGGTNGRRPSASTHSTKATWSRVQKAETSKLQRLVSTLLWEVLLSKQTVWPSGKTQEITKNMRSRTEPVPSSSALTVTLADPNYEMKIVSN